MKFNIGDLVQSSDGIGTVSDIFKSAQGSAAMYKVELEALNCETPTMCLYHEEDLEHYRPAMEQVIQLRNVEIRAEIADNVVIAIFYVDGKEVARGHGHIIHEGSDGIIQAFSWASKKAWLELDDKPYVRSTYRIISYGREY